MESQNTVQTLEQGSDLPPLPEGLQWDSPIRSPYGYKIEYENGKPYWRVATETEYKSSEARRLGIPPEQVEVKDIFDCYNTSPRECSSGCFSGVCRPRYNPDDGHYYCACGSL